MNKGIISLIHVQRCFIKTVLNDYYTFEAETIFEVTL